MNDIDQGDPGRAWWSDWLGAVPDPSGGFEVGAAATRGGARRCPIRLTSYGTTIEAVLLAPDVPGPLPAVVVPFYDVGSVLGERTPRTEGWPDERRRARAYGNHLVARGVAVLAVPWWFEQVADRAAPATSLHERYGPAAARHEATLPMTGLGRSVGDLMLAVDALLTVPWVDPARVGAFGHSLGAKLALHLAALDVRIGAAVAHEPGLGFAHSNWSDPWYLGSRIPAGRDQHELLGLIGRRPFLLAGGGASDGGHNEHLVERARLASGAAGLETLYHDSGHDHPLHVLVACYAWLTARLAAGDALLPERNPFT